MNIEHHCSRYDPVIQVHFMIRDNSFGKVLITQSNITCGKSGNRETSMIRICKTIHRAMLFVTAIVFSFSSMSFAQSIASNGANLGATIVSGVAIRKTADLGFGEIVSSATGGTVAIAAATGERTVMGVMSGQNSGNSAAVFSVTGQVDYSYALALPTTVITITKTTGSIPRSSMTVTDFTSSQTSSNDGGFDIGTRNFSVGATLYAGANQSSGIYTGSFTVTVTYQ